jgi:hypothetical protein
MESILKFLSKITRSISAFFKLKPDTYKEDKDIPDYMQW